MTYAFDDYALSLSPWMYLQLDDISGTSAVDASGNSQTGTYINSPTLNQPPLSLDQSGRSVKFNGSSQYITVPHHANFIASEFTFVALLNISTFSDIAGFFQHGDSGSAGNRGYAIYAHSSRIIGYNEWVSPGWTSLQTTYAFFSFGETFLLAMTYTDAGVRFYKNGSLVEVVGRTSGAKDGLTNPQTVNIGAFKDSSFKYFYSGYMSRAMFFTSSLTAVQIKTLYNTMLVSYRGAPLEVGKPQTQNRFTRWGH